VSGAANLGAVSEKKSLHADERDPPRVQTLRQEWWRHVHRLDVRRLVFVDERGANTAMTRLRARALRGERAHGSVPPGAWKALALVGALRWEGLVAALTVAAPTDTAIFRALVRHALVPVLRPQDVVVGDNLSSHQAPDLVAALGAVGASFLALPPSSPDLSPIEPCWSKVKQHLRKAKARTVPALDKAVTEALALITADDARGWFQMCGLCVH
jgi:transposase